MGEVAERSEDGEGKKAAIPSQSPAVTALPEGEPRDCTPHYVAYWHENGAYLYRYAPFTVLRPPIKEGVSLVSCQINRLAGQHGFVAVQLGDQLQGRVHTEHRHARVHGDDVPVCHVGRHGAAAALVRPTGITGMQVKSLKKKMKDKAFAAGVNRDIIRTCPDMGLTLEDFLQAAI